MSGSDSAAAEIRVGWDEYYGLIEQLALNVHRSGYAFDALLCLARGGLRPGDVLSRIFGKPLGVLTVSSYRDDGGRRRGDLRIAGAISSLDAELAGRILLVDDLADSGLTLEGVVNHLRRGYPRITELRTAVIWLKGCSEYRPDFFVRELPGSPWIHQPFERYDDLPPARLEREHRTKGERDDDPERCPRP